MRNWKKGPRGPRTAGESMCVVGINGLISTIHIYAMMWRLIAIEISIESGQLVFRAHGRKRWSGQIRFLHSISINLISIKIVAFFSEHYWWSGTWALPLSLLLRSESTMTLAGETKSGCHTPACIPHMHDMDCVWVEAGTQSLLYMFADLKKSLTNTALKCNERVSFLAKREGLEI